MSRKTLTKESKEGSWTVLKSKRRFVGVVITRLASFAISEKEMCIMPASEGCSKLKQIDWYSGKWRWTGDAFQSVAFRAICAQRRENAAPLKLQINNCIVGEWVALKVQVGAILEKLPNQSEVFHWWYWSCLQIEALKRKEKEGAEDTLVFAQLATHFLPLRLHL